jgi:DNA-binding MarR family transcriptional regulator
LSAVNIAYATRLVFVINDANYPMTIDNRLIAFMRYIDLAHQIEAQDPIAQLDASERFLLEILVNHWVQEHPLTVMQAMALKALGSPATVHRKITRLRKLDMIEAKVDAADSRIKYLRPKSSATRYFTQMGQALLDTAASL